jgi:hypothetical protein
LFFNASFNHTLVVCHETRRSRKFLQQSVSGANIVSNMKESCKIKDLAPTILPTLCSVLTTVKGMPTV